MATIQELEQSKEIYIPNGTESLASDKVNLQFRFALQGPGGTSKSWSSTTFTPLLFPQTTFLSYDRGLISHIGRNDIYEVRFYDGKFVDSIVKRDGLTQPPNRKDALIKWLETEGRKLTEKQLLVIDANTGIQTAYHIWWKINEATLGKTNAGTIDARREWNFKLKYYGEIMMLIKELRCSVIIIFHESPDRDDKGNLNGEVRPLLSGAFQDELFTHFTDWYRAHAVPKPTSDEEIIKFKKRFGINDATLKEWIVSTEEEHKNIYLWQTYTDRICKCKTSLKNPPQFVLAHANTFVKYKRTTI